MNFTKEFKSEHIAWTLGTKYGQIHRLADFIDPRTSEEMYRDAMAMGCPIGWFGVFKYGVQKVWRDNGEI